jgi:hypothetical protein
MWLAPLHYTETEGELTAFWAAVSSTTESMLGCLPNDTAHMEVVSELVTEIQKVEGRQS